jgi:hypothetical protein
MNADEIAETKRLEDETEYSKTEFQKLMDHELSELTSTERELISHLSVQEQVDFIKEHKAEGGPVL